MLLFVTKILVLDLYLIEKVLDVFQVLWVLELVLVLANMKKYLYLTHVLRKVLDRNPAFKFGVDIQSQTKVRVRKKKIQYGCLAAILKLTLLKINRLLHIYISIVPLKFGVDIQIQTKVKSLETKKSNIATRRPFWKWRRWKSIGFCLWPPSTCKWSLKLKFQSKLDLYSGNHATYRVQKPKNVIWPPGGHFVNDVAENQ